MSEIFFEAKGNPSNSARELLSYINNRHADAMSQISATVHLTEGEVEVGACLSRSRHFCRGLKDSVSIPVCGTESHPSVYIHTQPMMKWKPSEKDIRSTAQRGNLTRGFVTLTTNGIDSVFGSVVALPENVAEKIVSSEQSGPKLRSMLKKEGDLVKISSSSPPPTDRKVLRSAVESGLLEESYLDD